MLLINVYQILEPPPSSSGTPTTGGAGDGTVNSPRLLGLNEKCVFNTPAENAKVECGPGLICDSTMDNVCKTIEGNACGKDTECEAYNHCDSVCLTPKKDGDVCIKDRECDYYSRCLTVRSAVKICTPIN